MISLRWGLTNIKLSLYFEIEIEFLHPTDSIRQNIWFNIARKVAKQRRQIVPELHEDGISLSRTCDQMFGSFTEHTASCKRLQS